MNIIFAVIVLVAGFTPPWTEPTAESHYVGRESCTECHEEQMKLWQGSHDDLAMQVATEETVHGDFNNATFTAFGVTSRFFKKDGKFYVNTDGPDGTLRDYEITHNFGFYPLEQYLVKFPDGRYQALNICWDMNPKEKGGQRWFHLYPDQHIAHNDELRWTKRSQNTGDVCGKQVRLYLVRPFFRVCGTRGQQQRSGGQHGKETLVCRLKTPGHDNALSHTDISVGSRFLDQ